MGQDCGYLPAGWHGLPAHPDHAVHEGAGGQHGGAAPEGDAKVGGHATKLIIGAHVQAHCHSLRTVIQVRSVREQWLRSAAQECSGCTAAQHPGPRPGALPCPVQQHEQEHQVHSHSHGVEELLLPALVPGPHDRFRYVPCTLAPELVLPNNESSESRAKDPNTPAHPQKRALWVLK